MFGRIDTVSVIGALMLHASIALAMLSVDPPKAKTSTTVEVEVLKPPPPPVPVETPPEPPPPPPEPKVIPKVKAAPPPEVQPKPNQTPPAEPPKEPVKPVIGLPEVAMSNDSDSNVAMPTGNTTMGDAKNNPKTTAAITPLPAGTGPATKEYKPVADVYVKTLPDIDAEACARLVPYPKEAEDLGIEGEVKLRVALDETGKVHDIKVLSGPDHGLHKAAREALKYKCRFKPAMGTDGKPVAYVIQTYTWIFELPR